MGGGVPVTLRRLQEGLWEDEGLIYPKIGLRMEGGLLRHCPTAVALATSLRSPRGEKNPLEPPTHGTYRPPPSPPTPSQGRTDLPQIQSSALSLPLPS